MDNPRENPKRTWLDGPQIPSEFDGMDGQNRWPGEALGLPERGTGSLASVTRRAGGVAIDWLISLVLANLIVALTPMLGGVPTVTWGLFILIGFVSGWLFARTPGQAALGMGVARVDAPGERVGAWRAAARSVLTGLFFPAAMVDADGRGMHDRATGTAVIIG